MKAASPLVGAMGVMRPWGGSREGGRQACMHADHPPAAVVFAFLLYGRLLPGIGVPVQVLEAITAGYSVDEIVDLVVEEIVDAIDENPECKS